MDNSVNLKRLKDQVQKIADIESEIGRLQSGSYQLEAAEQARIPAKVQELRRAETVIRMELIKILVNWFY